ncbi:hypothetical protein O2V63_02680 [Modestobacter sp. VKM Ac-2977]|uniref:hypothetical protein n=1 Tax=Modestobacter sp. VKM Ac-2977 TaxID=3004131 RepID=UPI0022AA332C|nr:hypothetical protein [Modestobacter sp. VKM Ac-2977]MCZ2819231.1 hypothetical protein [Modestobacter sp. VKM Ac-2977]
MDVGEPVWQDLESPRDLTRDERRLLEQLVGVVGEQVLQRQLDAAVVTARCRCGCSSVRLHSTEAPVAEGQVRQLSGPGRSDHFSVDARSRAPGFPDVHVVLHVVQGRVEELELFAGEGVAVPLADLADPTDVTVA